MGGGVSYARKNCFSVFALAYKAFVFSHKIIAFLEKFYIVTIEMKYIFLPADIISITKVSQGNTKIVCERMHNFFNKCTFFGNPTFF